MTVDVYGVPTDAPDFRGAPPDPASLAHLGEKGLRYAVVDPADEPLSSAWIQADGRGFLGPRMSDQEVAWFREGTAHRRWIGVYDDSLGAAASTPVATTQSWPAELTVPGSTLESPRTLPSWAISSVTVAPTHRRRGVARELLEGELRTAAALGIPMAMLTVSESTIYGRFGFAPAAMAADWRIDTRRARWIGPETAAAGRVEFIEVAQWRDEAAAMHGRTRLQSAGQIPVWPLRWGQISGLQSSDESRSKALRAVHVVSPSGAVTAVALYQVKGGDPDFSQHTVELAQLISETADAEAALWRFFLEMDLVTELRAELRRVDEPVRWQIADFRSAKVDTWEHQYLRVLDVPAALQARTYAAPGRLVLEVSDRLAFASGRWLLTVGDDLSGTVTAATDQDAAAAPTLSLTANELAALYLGGVQGTTLVDAGRITERSAGDAARADGMLRSSRAPWLSFWY